MINDDLCITVQLKREITHLGEVDLQFLSLRGDMDQLFVLEVEVIVPFILVWDSIGLQELQVPLHLHLPKASITVPLIYIIDLEALVHHQWEAFQ